MITFDRNAKGFELLSAIADEQVEHGTPMVDPQFLKDHMVGMSIEQLLQLTRYLEQNDVLETYGYAGSAQGFRPGYSVSKKGHSVLQQTRAKGLIALDFSRPHMSQSNEFHGTVNAGVLGSNSGTVNQQIGLSLADLTQILASFDAITIHLDKVADPVIREEIAADIGLAKTAAAQGRNDRVLQLGRNIIGNLKTVLEVSAAAYALREPAMHLLTLLSRL